MCSFRTTIELERIFDTTEYCKIPIFSICLVDIKTSKSGSSNSYWNLQELEHLQLLQAVELSCNDTETIFQVRSLEFHLHDLKSTLEISLREIHQNITVFILVQHYPNLRPTIYLHQNTRSIIWNTWTHGAPNKQDKTKKVWFRNNEVVEVEDEVAIGPAISEVKRVCCDDISHIDLMHKSWFGSCYLGTRNLCIVTLREKWPVTMRKLLFLGYTVWITIYA